MTPIWEFEREGEIVRVSPKGPLVTSSADLLVGAGVDGLGIVSTFEGFVQPALGAGALVPVLPDWWQSFPGPFLYTFGRRHRPPPLRAFIDFLREEARCAAPEAAQGDRR